MFWSSHLSIFMSVRGYYSHAAYCCAGANAGLYAHGREPEFEDVVVVASSLSTFLAWVLREVNA